MRNITGREYIYGLAQDKNGAPYLFNMGELVRCKDCRHWNSETKGCKRNPSVQAWYETDFCNYGEMLCNYYGERKGGEDE